LDTQLLREAGAYFLAGHADCPNSSPTIKYASGLHELLANSPLSIDANRELAPVGRLTTDPWSPAFNGLVPAPQDRPANGRPALTGLADYWRQYDISHAVEQTLDAEGKRVFSVIEPTFYQGMFSWWQGHATLDYRTILRHGLPWYQERILRGLEEAERTGPEERQELFQALATTVDGVMALIRRYASECEDRATTTQGHGQARLRRLAGAFEQFLAGPPRGFFEALELVHFTNALDGYDNVGRLDQYLLPYYRQDAESGTVTPDRAAGLLADAFDIWGSCFHWQVVIGGTDQDGEDAANELTELILTARGTVKRTQPSVSVRLSARSPEALLDGALGLLEKGLGQPAMYNDDLYIHAFEQIGVPREAATEFVLGGCSECHIGGRSAARDAFFNLTKALEAVFYNGRISSEGPVFGPATGDPQSLRTFEEFFAAYKRQAEYLIDTFVHYRDHVQRTVARLQPALIRSIFVSGCLDSGRSNSAGGSEFDYGLIDVYGIPNVGNSLMAVKKLVYEDQRLSLSELVHALRSDFQGHEKLHAWCRELPQYGNDEDDVDRMTAQVADHAFDRVLQQRRWNGDGYYAVCASAPGMHVDFGKTTGPTPDGRLAGTPLANSMGPMQGTDGRGPTAMLNSVSKLPLWKCVGTPVLNLSLRPELLRPQQRETAVSLIRTFFRRGGMQLQISAVDKSTLLDAIEHPERHSSLIVRVAGYAARFTELSRELQEEVVSRTVH